MALFNVAPGIVKAWEKKKVKDNRLVSVWDELSNLADDLESIPNTKQRKVPKDVVHYVNSEGSQTPYETTIPLVEGLKEDGVGGLQTAEGTGETPYSAFTKVYWNTCRKVMNVSKKGVQNIVTEYLGVVQEAHSKLSDWHAENKDHRCQQALIEGGDRYITEDQYWKDYTELPVAPVKKMIHSNIAFPGMASVINRDFGNYNTDMERIVQTLGMLTAANKFDLSALDGTIRYAYRFVKPVKMSGGNEPINYIILLSPFQADQLGNDPRWLNLMMKAEKRGPENRALSGILGNRKGCLIIEDQRSPILNLKDGKFEYVTAAEASVSDALYGFGKLNREEKGAGATGTMEIARILGSGAIGVPRNKKISFESNKKDFGVQNEICSEIECGYNRLDFKGKNKDDSEKIKNISSALYFTPTPTITY